MPKDRFILLVDRYLSGTVTESEALLVNEYLVRLEATGNASAVEAEEPLKKVMWQKILSHTTSQTAPVIKTAWYQRKIVRLTVIAASLACLIGLSLLFSNNQKNEQTAVQPIRIVKNDPPSIRHIINTSGKDENISLADGSTIILANKSEIIYTEPFIQKRDINLIGKAGFKVAQNKTKPFTVTSRAITTTALGTDFTVTALANTPRITVRLYEGKVVVKAVNKGDNRMKKDFYLLSGQEFIYSNQAMARVRNFGVDNTVAKDNTKDDLVGTATTQPQNTSGSWYLFNNQSLGLVFNQLSELYDVKIVYNKQDVRRKYFVGKFNKSDSLDIILKYITTANRLTFSKKDNIYYINK